MEDNWETHVSPLMMGVGMGEMQSMGEMQQPQHQQHHHQDMAQSSHHLDMSQGIHQDIEQDLVHHDLREHALDDAQDYYSHQVGDRNVLKGL